MADDIQIDVDDFTFDELEAMEDATGKALPELFTAKGPTAAGWRAAVYVFKRREDPEFDWDATAKLTINGVVEELNDPSRKKKVDPTTAASD